MFPILYQMSFPIIFELSFLLREKIPAHQGGGKGVCIPLKSDRPRCRNQPFFTKETCDQHYCISCGVRLPGGNSLWFAVDPGEQSRTGSGLHRFNKKITCIRLRMPYSTVFVSPDGNLIDD